MAIFSVIDTSSLGDTFYEGMVDDAANWALLESLFSATAGKVLVAAGTGTIPVMTTPTGTGTPVFSNSPTLVTPALGTPASGVITNCTGTPTLTLTNCSGYSLASPGAIGETTPNTIRATNKEIFKTATADSPLTAVECSRTIVSNYGMTDADCAITLPTAAAGLLFMCILPAVQAHYFHLVAAGTDVIYLNGVAGSAAGYVGVASGYATGTACSFFTFKASDGGYDWFALAVFGNWIAG
jgi:hypothetical protein